MGKYSEAVARAQIVAIVRLDNYDRALAVAEALLAGGINAIEYTLTGSGAFAAVSKVRNALGDRMLVGVGTVLSEQDATESIAAGAQFLVTPAVRPKVIKKATKAGIPTCCGALTPTEALTAHEAGAEFIKIFPARNFGPAYIKDMLAPLPFLKLIPTGGIDASNLQSYLAAGATGVGIGGSLVTAKAVDAGDWQQLTNGARACVAALRGVVMPEVLTFGECMAVLYPPDPVVIDDAPLLKWDIGGAEANCAIALARLGVTSRFHTRIGNDPFGRRMVDILSGEGVDTSAMQIDATRPTGVFFREWLADGARRVFYYRAGSAAANMGPEDLNASHFAGIKAMHLTGITPALSERAAALCTHAIGLAKAAGVLITFDPNFRPRLWSADSARSTLTPIAAAVDVMLMGHEDAAALFGPGDDEHYLSPAVALGIKTVVLKRAERGALAIVDGQRYEATVVAAERVIDPVGAGDGFDAGFIAGLLRGKSIPEALHLGAIVGAGSVAHLGDYAGYPTISV